MAEFKQGDRIIWDSHFGYEIGSFIEASDNAMYNSYRIDLITGICQGEGLRSKSEIKPYSPELAKELAEKYQCSLKEFNQKF